MSPRGNEGSEGCIVVTTALAKATMRLLPGGTEQASLLPPTPDRGPTTIPSLVKVSQLLAFLAIG